MHCQECQRDTVCKRLLALRHRQHQTHLNHVQRSKLCAYPSVANRIREVFAYDVDEEEKRLWEEVAAVTGGGAGPLSFSRVGGVSCGASATHWRQAVDDGSDEETREDCVDVPDDGLLATESAILFRDVSVY